MKGQVSLDGQGLRPAKIEYDGIHRPNELMVFFPEPGSPWKSDGETIWLTRCYLDFISDNCMQFAGQQHVKENDKVEMRYRRVYFVPEGTQS